MDYLKSEHLKFKRTISNKLIFIVPLITAIFAWLMGGYMGYQYMTLYWWYAFLLPGAIAILCSLSHRKEENAGKYYSVFSMPVNLSRFEFAKGIILVEKLLVSAIFLALLISISREAMERGTVTERTDCSTRSRFENTSDRHSRKY